MRFLCRIVGHRWGRGYNGARYSNVRYCRRCYAWGVDR